MSTTPAGKHVLVVDDDRAVLRVIEKWLTTVGYAVDVCDTFEHAKERLSNAPPDVLLTDVRLGAFNGLQLVILAKEQHPKTVAVVMSAYDDPMLRREASQCGAVYLQKPFTGEAVLNSVSATPPSEAAVT